MEYPLIGAKHRLPSIVPGPAVAGVPDPPRAAILCYPRWLLREVLESEATSPYIWPYRGDVHRLGNGIALVGGIGVGAPAAAMLVEELGAQGVTTFIVMGMAGALQPDLQPGDVVVADRALRDEGVSHHYLPEGRFSTPSERLTARLSGRLRPARVGATWTTDAPYRETAEEVCRYRAEDIATVEMEAAAVFAVAQVRGYEAAAAFVVSDLLTENGWTGHFDAAPLRPNLRRVLASIRELLVEFE
ncbi:MAG TPA: nucleoside phosphorylase [Mycobacteriales bacterium]|nr:nucleoside phosphorylase [Mycobacteriales bacterium]